MDLKATETKWRMEWHMVIGTNKYKKCLGHITDFLILLYNY